MCISRHNLLRDFKQFVLAPMLSDVPKEMPFRIVSNRYVGMHANICRLLSAVPFMLLSRC